MELENKNEEITFLKMEIEKKNEQIKILELERDTIKTNEEFHFNEKQILSDIDIDKNTFTVNTEGNLKEKSCSYIESSLNNLSIDSTYCVDSLKNEYNVLKKKLFSDDIITNEMWDDACSNSNQNIDDLDSLLRLKECYLQGLYIKWSKEGRFEQNFGKWVSITNDDIIPNFFFETKEEAEEFGVFNMSNPMCFVCFKIGDPISLFKKTIIYS
jgi:hypothetical protein